MHTHGNATENIDFAKCEWNFMDSDTAENQGWACDFGSGLAFGEVENLLIVASFHEEDLSLMYYEVYDGAEIIEDAWGDTRDVAEKLHMPESVIGKMR